MMFNSTSIKLTTTSFSEIGDWTELCVDGSSSEPPVVEFGHGFGRVLLTTELDVDVAHQVIAQVVANVHFLNFAVSKSQVKRQLRNRK